MTTSKESKTEKSPGFATGILPTPVFFGGRGGAIDQKTGQRRKGKKRFQPRRKKNAKPVGFWKKGKGGSMSVRGGEAQKRRGEGKRSFGTVKQKKKKKRNHIEPIAGKEEGKVARPGGGGERRNKKSFGPEGGASVGGGEKRATRKKCGGEENVHKKRAPFEQRKAA